MRVKLNKRWKGAENALRRKLRGKNSFRRGDEKGGALEKKKIRGGVQAA